MFCDSILLISQRLGIGQSFQLTKYVKNRALTQSGKFSFKINSVETVYTLKCVIILQLHATTRTHENLLQFKLK